MTKLIVASRNFAKAPKIVIQKENKVLIKYNIDFVIEQD
jgi:hypothetical protein